LDALESRLAEIFETYFKMFLDQITSKHTIKVKEEKEVQETKKGDKDESKEYVE
jgi:hypothetical protein